MFEKKGFWAIFFHKKHISFIFFLFLLQILTMLETNRLRLIPYEDAHFQAILQKNMIKLGQLLKVYTPTQWTTFKDMEEAMPYFYESYKKNPTQWGSFFVIHKKDKQLLGTCGYKGSLDEEGMIEIGYEIHENYRLQGLATETAKILRDNALNDTKVKKIWAHTLAFDNPSVSVLKKLDFKLIGQFHEPIDGDIWRWEYKKIIEV